jgi:integrase
MNGVKRLVACLLYGSGLRLLEGLQLRVKDIDLERLEPVFAPAKAAMTGSRCFQRRCGRSSAASSAE